MGMRDEVDGAVYSLVRTDFNIRQGYVVPSTEGITLANGAVRVNATFMYSDLAGSSKLARDHPQEDAAKVIRAFLSTAARVIKNRDGAIRSFDGDRVMAVFTGIDGPSRAAKASLELKWLLDNVVQAKIDLWLDSVRDSGWKLSHGTGIAIGETLMVRGGVRGSNDLVSVGDAPNIAAKLSERREHRTWVTDQVWDALPVDACFYNEKAIWSSAERKWLGDRYTAVRYSDWGWVVS